MEKIINIIAGWAMGFLIAVIFLIIFNNLVPGYYVNIIDRNYPPISLIIYGCVLAPLLEEFVYRYIPLTVLSKLDTFEENKWLFLLGIAIVFGYNHGGYFNVFIQGPPGFFFGWVYIKNEMSYTSAVLTHSLYNFVLMIVFPSLT